MLVSCEKFICKAFICLKLSRFMSDQTVATEKSWQEMDNTPEHHADGADLLLKSNRVA